MSAAKHFQSIETARAFALAGNALLTLSSRKTGLHFTYQVQKAKNGEVWFVKRLIAGSADEGAFAYTGIIKDGVFRTTAKAGISPDAPCVKAFEFFMRCPTLHPQMEIRHEGKCGRCGRTLTVPSSIDAGIGPDCQAKML